MIAKFLEVRRREIWSEVGSTLSESTLRNIDPPRDIDSEESVRGRYHPQGLATAPTVGAPGDGSTTIARVQSGKADLEAAAEVKQTMRAGFVSKAADVQSTVNQDLGKGFFNDPKLRE